MSASAAIHALALECARETLADLGPDVAEILICEPREDHLERLEAALGRPREYGEGLAFQNVYAQAVTEGLAQRRARATS